MKAIKIIVEIITVLGVPYGLFKYDILQPETAAVLAVVTLIFVLGFEELRSDLSQKICDGTATIKHNLKVVSDFLIKQPGFDPKELKNYSPLSLTDVGKKFITDNGFDKVLQGHENDFFDFISKENPKLKYDVETAAIKSIYVLSDKPYMDFLKIFFYNNPGKNINNTAPTLGVFVRDKYLEKHKEITQ